MLLLLFTACAALIYGCGDSNTEEACRYEVSRNLDQGNYDDVINSACASCMDKGAAYFGRAGYDVYTILENFMDANDTEGSATDNELSVYMNSLLGSVDSAVLQDMDSAKGEYLKVLQGEEGYEDAQFYANTIIGPVRSLGGIKGIIDPDGDGGLSSDDANGNDTPDEVDAVSCAMLVAFKNLSSPPLVGDECNTVLSTYAPFPPNPVTTLNFANLTGTYQGIVVTVNGGQDYRKLLDSTGTFAATTTSEQCTGSDGNLWPCPYEVDGQPSDIVTELVNALNDADTSLAVLLGNDDAEASEAIDDLLANISGSDGITNSASIAAYLQDLDL
jgi:hypothetical protein